MFVPCDNITSDFRDFTLILPAVSVGNVGQLAADLIISTLDMTKVGYIYTDCLVPMVGNNPYATSEENAQELSINAEVYSLAARKLTVVQIRSPVIKNKSRSLCQLLISWMKKNGFGRVIILSSSHAYQRDDQQLLGIPFRYLLTPALQSSVGNLMQKLNWKEMEQMATYPGISETEKRIVIPGGGITKILYNYSCTEEIPLAVLLKFCSEGDNVPDAFALVDYLNEWLQLVQSANGDCTVISSKWKVPSSWRLLFGSGLPPALF
ncbi:proteasome assembly chaperone 2 [Microcaecilia unicolor]|uniref:Proteasome assembly chaperone 2 n=1 Tax=Microcaecilia unicolor TaxID=1415580 RepID=A0A6P7YLK7_9AMPH|nr:proteasome assembly chaperone 2 [Microcaecilia unicolor]